MTGAEREELRQAIHSPKFYDLMQEWRFTKVSEGSKAADVYSRILDEVIESVSSIMEKSSKKGSKNHVKA